MLPEIWQSIFYHAELDLLLVVYVDDFKMAGPQANLAEGWKRISSVIDMDPPELFGRYFGCHHFEETGVKLPREAHPFAYVFDKKHAAAAQGNLKPPRTELGGGPRSRCGDTTSCLPSKETLLAYGSCH